ncbi:MAG: DUF4118 domain-containing protein [Lachnospiraceae bacterium]|nr:DUF4118 domain-containing protein [Lachnospiraceae bacterium]
MFNSNQKLPSYDGAGSGQEKQNGILQEHSFQWSDVLKSILVLFLASCIGLLFQWLGFTEANIVTIYILSVLIIAVITTKRSYSLISTVASVGIFNFLFTEPKYTLLAYDKGYFITFFVMFSSALITGTLAAKLKNHARESARVAYRTKILLDTAQMLEKEKDSGEIAQATAGQLVKLLGRDVIFYLSYGGQLKEPYVLTVLPDGDKDIYLRASEKNAAVWVMKNNKPAGAATEYFSDAKCLYLSLSVSDNVYGVVGIAVREQSMDTFENSILLSILGECALALENNKNAREKEEAAVLAKNEQLRANLLRSISHDLRTPLTSISGNASNLLSNGACFDEETKRQLYSDIYDDSMWLINLVENLLAVTRIEDGTMNLRLTAELMDEIVAESLRHVNRISSRHEICVENMEDLLLVKADARLIIQVIINMIDNAVKYTPEGSHICIHTEKTGDFAAVRISDDGPGVSDEDKLHIFEMFYSGRNQVADNRRSLGLGLALCKSIVTAHGGEIRVEDNLPHGCVFTFTLPLEEVELHE